MRLSLLILGLLLPFQPLWADVSIQIHYLRVDTARPPTLSSLDPRPDDLGWAGAQLGLIENKTTGQFLDQDWDLQSTTIPQGQDALAQAEAILSQTDLMLVDAPADILLRIADLPQSSDALLFNISAGDPDLRDDDCRSNLLHTLPSTQMRTDALAQFFVTKRWDDLAMIAGPHQGDQAFADAITASLTKFGLTVSARKEWRFDADMRRNAAQEVPIFTQDLGDYDALIIADELHDFGRYVAYNTWQPRPITGSEGLTPQTWDKVVEQWGAAQLQSRFQDTAQRPMQPHDYAAWAAIRSLGEAVTRTGSAEISTLKSYLLGSDFELAGFKGRPLTYRDWNGQLRQPIALVHPRALVAMAPLDGFLHPTSELDTLGLDRPESRCTAFQ